MIIVDASAVLALLLNEPCSDDVALLLTEQSCGMSTVNRVEVITRLAQLSNPQADHTVVLNTLPLSSIDFTVRDADVAAALRPATAHLGLGLGDRACLATATVRDALVVTADRAWGTLDIGLDIHVLR